MRPRFGVAARPFRKPLVLLSPKSLLRHKDVRSSLAEMGPGTSFCEVLPALSESELVPPDRVRRLIFCSGRVHVDLVAAIREHARGGVSDVVVHLIEQIAPFPYQAVQSTLIRFPAAELVWCQEEPMNGGAWAYVRPRFETACRAACTGHGTPAYIGRDPSAAPATGLAELHRTELSALIAEAVK